MGQVDCHRLLDRPGFGQTRKAMQRFQIVWLFGYTRTELSFCVLHRPNLETGGGTIKPSGANRRNPNASENPCVFVRERSPTIVVPATRFGLTEN